MKYATVLQRVVAWIIDIVIIGIVMVLIFGIGFSSLLMGSMALFGTAVVSMFLVMFIYTIGLETYWRGQTVGKKVLQIRVVTENGKRIKFREAFLRNILRILDNQFAGIIGLILIVVTKKKQRIGDMIAKTVVVKD